jgi:homoserine O-acetyltransferase
MGGSMGGYQALEWALIEPKIIDKLFLLATSATESAWGIAIHAAQRLAIEADNTWNTPVNNAGAKGLIAARAIGILSYRNYSIMVKDQTDHDIEKMDDYKATSYINYQGNKLAGRFNANSYWQLTKSMDSHHIARGRNLKTENVLKKIIQKTLIIGISSDILCPIIEQQFLAKNIPNAEMIVIDSNYGHDGFLVESKIISQHLAEWLGDFFVLGFGASI